MNNTSYEEKSLTGATGVELIIALYDAAIRFLYRAIQCIEEEDVHGRRIAVKKTIDILMYLQARLRPELGPAPAKALSDFYAAMFTMILEASHVVSKTRLEESIACIRNVRGAWVIAARDPTVGKILPRELRTREEKYRPAARPEPYDGEAPVSRWSA
jgi:flagellar secretion chaperone FliS